MESRAVLGRFSAYVRADGKLIAVGLVLALPILVFDLLYPLGVAAGVPYIVLVLICLWAKRPASAYLMATLGTGLTLLGYFLSPEGGVPWVVQTNRGLAIFAIWAVAFFSAKKIVETEKRRSAEEDQLATLQGLSDSEARLQLIIDSVPGAISYFDNEVRFRFANKHYTSILNMRSEELIGKTLKEAVGEEVYSRVERHVERALAGEIVTFENIVPNSAAGELAVSVTCVPHRLQDGTIDGFFALVYDITKQKEAEKELKTTAQKLDRRVAERTAELEEAMTSLQESEARFQQVFRKGPLGIAIVGQDSNLMAVNESFCRMMEYSEEELIGRSFSDITHPDDIEEGMRIRTEILAGEVDQYRFTKRYITKSGKTIWANLTSAVVRTSEGEPLYSIGMLEDITERRRAEERLRDSEVRYRTIVNTTKEGFWRIDQNMRIVECNDAVCLMTGYPREELLGMKPFGLVDDSQNPDLRAQIEKDVRRRMNARDWDGRLKKKDGSFIDVYISATNFRDLDGNPMGRFAFISDITERKRAEEALRESEDRYAFAVAGSQDGLWDRNVQTGETYFSPRWKAILGYEDHELDNVSETFLDALHAEDRERVIQAIDAHLEDRVPYDIEYRLRHKDGSHVWVQSKGQAIWDEDGNPLRMAGSISDISARKAAEEALQASEQELANAQRIARMGSWERNLKTGETRWSDELYSIFGVTRESYEPNLENFFTRVHPDDVEDIGDQLAQSLENCQRVDLRYRIIWPNGEIRHLESNCEMSLNEKGEPARLTGVTRDVTERYEAVEALKESEARFAEILRIAPEAVITVGGDMNIQLFNEGAERIFGYDADEVLGQFLDILMPEYFRDSHRRHVEEFDGSGSTYRLMDRSQEIVGLRKDGSEFPASASVSKLETHGEKIFTIMLLDVTERKRAQDALLEAKHEAEVANEAKSEFLASMSHDLRTPLNAILGFADMIYHQYFGPVGDKYREYAVDIRTSGSHLLSLLNEILDLSELEAGKKSLREEEFDLLEVFAECDMLVSQKAKSAGIELKIPSTGNQLFLFSDRQALMQVLLNLLSNSIRFTPNGGKITLSAVMTDRETVITVTDTGVGIEPIDLAKITDPFVRGEYNPYLAKEGWGLGLAIVKSLVSLLDGEFEIHSQVGQGTTVKVILPTGYADQVVATAGARN